MRRLLELIQMLKTGLLHIFGVLARVAIAIAIGIAIVIEHGLNQRPIDPGPDSDSDPDSDGTWVLGTLQDTCFTLALGTFSSRGPGEK